MTINSLENPHRLHSTYDHKRYEVRRRILRFLMKYVGFSLLAKIDQIEGLENVPQSGPAILMINHIAFIDPIVVLNVVPRNVVPLAKEEALNIPGWGIFPRIWEVIPVRREEVDRRAIQQVLHVLRAGEMVLVAPEGTRGPELQRGKEGVAYLASRGEVPIVAVGLSRTQGFPSIRGTSRWKSPGATVRFGRPFMYKSIYRKADRRQLRKMTDEAMYILAELLPSEQRGVYANLEAATKETIIQL